MPHSAPALGLMQGAPPPPERLVTSDNWIEGPFNRWGFLHVRELARTARISRGAGPVTELPSDPRDLTGVAVEGLPLATALDEAYVDGICVVQDGAVVFEHYVDGMRPDDTHLCMSVSKSLTATLIGVLVGEGVLDPAGAVTGYIPLLRGTAWEGCTIQHLLDMRAGTRFDEDDYSDLESDGVLLEFISGYRTHRRPDLPPDTYTWIAGMDNDREHGAPFKYRSILTDVLAWAAASATGTSFPELFSDRIWSRIGAERDADIIVDAAGFPVVEGGICTSLRDLARFGLMHLREGDGVVPADWIRRVRDPGPELIETFADDTILAGFPNACYHDCWWISDPDAGVYSGYGINGQQLLVHHPTRTVIARFSTWPDRWDDRLFALGEAIDRAVLERL
jgi:CubicO group peptidase (beta-lactamase class C family)